MSMDKAIKYGKEHRKQWTGSKAIDKTCRCHGGCVWCEGNRKYKFTKKIEKMLDRMEELGYNTNRKRGKMA